MPDALRLAARDVASLGSVAANKWKRTQSALAELDRSVAHATGTARAIDNTQAKPPASIVSTAVDWSTASLVGLTKATFAALLKTGAIALLTFFLLCSGDALALRLSRWCDDRPRGRGRFSLLVSNLAREMRRFALGPLLVLSARVVLRDANARPAVQGAPVAAQGPARGQAMPQAAA